MTKTLAVVFGIVFVLVGILGFIDNPIVGEMGFFETDAIHNIVHLLVGIVLLFTAGSASASAKALKVFGVIYIVLFLNGLLTPDMLLGFVHQNSNDTWLHLVLGIVLLGAGMAGKKDMGMNAPMNTPGGMNM